MALRTPETPEQDTNPIQGRYDDSKGSYSSELEQLKRLKAIRDDHPDAISAREGMSGRSDEDIQSQEESPDYPWKDKVTSGESNNKRAGRISRVLSSLRITRKKGIAGGVAGGGIALAMFGFGFFGLYVGPIAAVANTVMDLSDPLSAVDERAERLLESKLFRSPLAYDEGFGIGCSGVTGKLPIKCRYGVATKKLTDKLSNAGIEVLTSKRIGPLEIPETFRMDGRTFTAAELRDYIRRDPSANLRYKRALNTNWLMMKGNTYIKGVLKRFGVSQAKPQYDGTVDEQAQKLKSGGAQVTSSDIDPSKLVEARNADGSIKKNAAGETLYSIETGEVITTSDGSTFRATDDALALSPSEVESIKATAPDMSAKNNPISRMRPSTFTTVLAGINYLGHIETACTLHNMIGHATVLAKVSNTKQLAEFAMTAAPMVGALQANDLSPEEAEVIQKFFYDTDNREFISALIPSENGELELSDKVKNPDYGKNALDSDLFRMSEGNGIATNSANRPYSLGFGASSFLNSVNGAVDFTDTLGKAVTGGAGCGQGTLFVARWGGLILTAGVLISSFVFTTPGGGAALTVGTAAKAAASIAVFTAAMSGIEYMTNRMLKNEVINETMAEAPLERGAAFWTGMAAMNSEHSMRRGMMPGNAEQIVAYQQQQNIVRQEIIAIEKQDSSFFDVNDPYSVSGSVALAASSSLPNTMSASAISSIPASLFSFVIQGFSSSLKPYSAQAATLDKSRYEQCDDRSYLDIGIQADVQCNVRFVMPRESMQWDPLDTAQWMEDNDYVEDNTTTGLPEGYSLPDSGKPQSVAEDLILGVVNDFYNTRDYVNDYGKFLDFCVYRAMPFGKTFEDQGAWGDAGDKWVDGRNCLVVKAGDHGASEEFAQKINRFRAYVFDMSINDDLDESPVQETSDYAVEGGGARISESQLRDLIKQYGLPDPTSEGVNGWEALLKKLTDNPDAKWATEAMLAGEKNFMDRGGDLKEYLNTAWLWFENGSSKWPDPYMINCNDNRAGYVSEVSFQCRVGNFQVAGYQPADRAANFVEMFNKFYSESEISSIMEKSLQNSDKASSDIWKYNDASQKDKGLVSQHLRDVSSASIDDIATNRNQLLGDSKTQFLSLLLGKDPNIATALNSFAVSDSDLLAAIQGSGCGYGYICELEKQLLANMIYSLWKFDSQYGSNSPSGAKGSGVGISAIFNGSIPSIGQEFGPTEWSTGEGAWMYKDYGPEYGVTGHTGVDYSASVGTTLYSPVEGTVVTAGGTGYFTDERGDGPGKGELKILTKDGHEVILGHMEYISVAKGSKVTVGQSVGRSGTYGDGKKGHLHLEYRIPDTAPELVHGLRIVDPRNYL